MALQRWVVLLSEQETSAAAEKAQAPSTEDAVPEGLVDYGHQVWSCKLAPQVVMCSASKLGDVHQSGSQLELPIAPCMYYCFANI